jgi:UPF0271 protein
MATTVNINADLGESFGRYTLGDDASLLKIIKSANIACGMHAGDPTVMRRTVELAKANGVSVGAHPGFNDIWGFGRREMQMRSHDLENLVAYQIAALVGISGMVGVPVTHVKPHGALHNMASRDPEMARAVVKGIKAIDPNLVLVCLATLELEKAGLAIGLPVAREAYIDRVYEDDGSLRSRMNDDAMIHDPEVAAAHVVRMIVDKTIVSRSGKRIPCTIDSLCVHGDEPTTLATAAAARKALEKAGVQVVTLPEMGIAKKGAGS